METEKKVEIIGGPDATSTTFVLKDEDHTLGNALRHVLSKNRKVELCGYTIPHPLEAKLQLRLQTYEEPATEVLKEGVTTLNDICDHILDTFHFEIENFKSNSSSKTSEKKKKKKKR